MCVWNNPHCRCSDPQLLGLGSGQSTPHLHSQGMATQSKRCLEELVRRERKGFTVKANVRTVEAMYSGHCMRQVQSQVAYSKSHMSTSVHCNIDVASSTGHSQCWEPGANPDSYHCTIKGQVND